MSKRTPHTLVDTHALWEASRKAQDALLPPTTPPIPVAPRPTPAREPGWRPLTLVQAVSRYPDRYTMEHQPTWATYPLRRDPVSGQPTDWYAPQFESDAEWYALSVFPGEHGLSANSRYVVAARCTWPLGMRLAQPYRIGALDTEAPHVV